jgi:cyclopropane fatty-acyl-phospholipid synthase-like methyltransferase
MSGIRSLLRHPAVYLFFQYLMNSHGKYRMCIDRFLIPVEGKRILDIGCGCADILSLLPRDVNYVGYDVSNEYIAYARKRFGHRATFHNQRVNEITLLEDRPFDIVIADGLLHHLNDDEARNLFEIGYTALRDSGFMFTADPTLVENQGVISRRISLMDRGKHVRSPEEYKRIALSVFPRVDAHVIDNVSNRLQTGCFLKCYKSG